MELEIVRDGQMPFTALPNSILEREPRLSWKAKGLYAYLIGRPNGWRVQMADLVARSSDGEAAVKSGLRELEDAGYITRRQTRLGNGQMGPVKITVLMPEVQYKNQLKPEGGFPLAVFPPAAFPPADNRPHNNTKGNKKECSKKNESTPSRALAENGLSGRNGTAEGERTAKGAIVQDRAAGSAEKRENGEPRQESMLFPVQAGTFDGFTQAFPRMWNRMANATGAVPIQHRQGMPAMLSESRLKRARAIWADETFRRHWKEALQALYGMPDYCGANKRGYRINVDGFLDVDVFTKLWERAASSNVSQEHSRDDNGKEFEICQPRP